MPDWDLICGVPSDTPSGDYYEGRDTDRCEMAAWTNELMEEGGRFFPTMQTPWRRPPNRRATFTAGDFETLEDDFSDLL